MDNLPTNFDISRTFRSVLIRQHLIPRLRRYTNYLLTYLLTYLLALTFDLVTRLVDDAVLRAPSVYQVLSLYAFPFGRYDALPVSALIGLVTLTFDLETGAHYCLSVDNFPTNFGVSRTFCA